MNDFGLQKAGIAMPDPMAAKGEQLRRMDKGEGNTREVAERMEALFATMLVKEMRSTLPNGFFGDGPGSDVMEGWLDEHVGQVLAKQGALDLVGMVRTSLSNMSSSQTGEVQE